MAGAPTRGARARIGLNTINTRDYKMIEEALKGGTVAHYNNTSITDCSTTDKIQDNTGRHIQYKWSTMQKLIYRIKRFLCLNPHKRFLIKALPMSIIMGIIKFCTRNAPILNTIITSKHTLIFTLCAAAGMYITTSQKPQITVRDLITHGDMYRTMHYHNLINMQWALTDQRLLQHYTQAQQACTIICDTTDSAIPDINTRVVSVSDVVRTTWLHSTAPCPW